jgi:hypothetical protein
MKIKDKGSSKFFFLMKERIGNLLLAAVVMLMACAVGLFNWSRQSFLGGLIVGGAVCGAAFYLLLFHPWWLITYVPAVLIWAVVSLVVIGFAGAMDEAHGM